MHHLVVDWYQMKMAIINYINALKMGNDALLSCAHLGGFQSIRWRSADSASARSSISES